MNTDYTNCRNCGAPKEHIKCNYCGTNDKAIKKQLNKYNPKDAYEFHMLATLGIQINQTFNIIKL